MVLNEIGRSIRHCWDEIPDYFPHVLPDEFVVMPNHVHGIVWILEQPIIVGAQFIAPEPAVETARGAVDPSMPNRGAINRAPTLGEIIRAFKARVTFRARKSGLGFGVWQRNYYERIVRNEEELQAIRRYIRDNPLKWGLDPERKGAR